jgi:signal transduction histidine kinase
MLDDLLAASRSHMAEQKIERAPLDLAALVAESCDHVRARAEMKRQRLEVELEQVAWLRGDTSLLRRLLNILLDNALKYTPTNGMVRVSLCRVERRLLLEVRDTGIGIPATELPYIFDRFYRADTSRSREEGGNGLGLAIAKWISEAHRAQISVSSDLGSGSAFFVSFDDVIDLSEVVYASLANGRKIPALESKE